MVPRITVLRAAAGAFLLACGHDAGVCGDGILDPGEACDAEGEGCDAACHLTGATAWTIELGAANETTEIHAVAVGPTGEIVVLGSTTTWSGDDPDHDAWLLALDDAGGELWRRSVPLTTISASLTRPHLAIAADGAIYVQGDGLHRLGPRGEPMWDVMEDRALTTLTLADGAVYVAGFAFSATNDPGDQLYQWVVQRRDPAAGDRVWEYLVAGDDGLDTYPSGLAVLGDVVFAAGSRNESDPAYPGLTVPHVLHVTLDAGTGAAGPLIEGDAVELWGAVAASPGGDVIVAGQTEDAAFMRRLALDGTPRWAVDLDGPPFMPVVLAVGPDETIAVAGGVGAMGQPRALLRGWTGDGAPAWTVEHLPATDDGVVSIVGSAFGPGFLVAAGVEERHDSWNTGWVRKIGPGPDLAGDSTGGDETTGEPVPESVLECPQPAACGRVDAFDGCPGDPTPTAYSASQACALAALAAGEPVRLAQFHTCAGLRGDIVLVRSDRSVIVQRFEGAAGGVTLEGAVVETNSFAASELCTLKPAAYFEACLAGFDVNCAFVASWVEGCTSHAPAACEP